MKVSFLVTYYNQEQFVRNSIESLLAIEKPKEWEILVGDDGSDDGTVEIVKEYISLYPYNIFLYVMPRDNKKNYYSVTRASENRLNLLKHSTGDYFCILDGDDYYCDKNFITEALNIFESNKALSVVGFNFKYVYPSYEVKNKLGKFPDMCSREINVYEYIRRYYTPAAACVFKKCFGKERIEYIKSAGAFDDNTIVMNNLNFGGFYLINKPILAYRQTEGSVYNSMGELEQAVLNCYGYDILKNYLEEEFAEAVLYRNRYAIMKTFVWRNELKNLLGHNYNKYLAIAKDTRNSLLYKILNFDKSNCTEKDDTEKVIRKLKLMGIKECINMQIKYWIYRFKSKF